MKTNGLARLAGATAVAVAMGAALAAAQGSGNRYSAALTSSEEVPAVSSGASGTIVLDIDEGAGEIRYWLSYSGLNGTVAQSHIHFAQPGVNGGIVLWLCNATATPPAGITPPACPQEGTVSGTLTADDVLGIGTQQIGAGDLGEAIDFIRKGLGYANVHTSLSPGGEIRGQIRAGGGHR